MNPTAPSRVARRPIPAPSVPPGFVPYAEELVAFLVAGAPGHETRTPIATELAIALEKAGD